MCSEICQFNVAPKSAMVQRDQLLLLRTHVAEYVSSRLFPAFQGYKGFADEVLLQAYTCALQKSGLHPGPKFNQSFADQLLLSAYTCVLQNGALEGCTRGSRITRVRPTSCCCEQTHVCCKTNQIRAAPKGRYVTRVRSTRRCCKHTHVCCRTIKLRVSPKGQRLQRLGLADHLLRRAHTCALQNTTMQSCTEGQGIQRFGRPWEHTHVRAEQMGSGLHPKVKGYKGLPDQLLQ